MSFETPQPAPAPSGGGAREIGEPLYRAKGWMKFLSVLLWINAVLLGISIIGLIVAWLPAWAGYLLWKSADEAERGYDGNDAATMRSSVDRVRLLITIAGVIALVQIAFIGFFIIAGGFAALTQT